MLEQVVALEPQTSTGLPTYALGEWFGDGQTWALANIDYFAAHSEGIYPIPSGYTFAINTLDSTPVTENQLTTTSSRFWTAVDFYAEAYRRGLLDPDSFTMTQQMWQDKISAGQYMYCMFGWEPPMPTANSTRMKATPWSSSAFPPHGVVEGRISNMFAGERKYCISAQTQYPEKCVELLDFVSTYENSLILINGLEGDTWNRDENGELVPTDEYLACDREDDHLSYHPWQLRLESLHGLLQWRVLGGWQHLYRSVAVLRGSHGREHYRYHAGLPGSLRGDFSAASLSE